MVPAVVWVWNSQTCSSIWPFGRQIVELAWGAYCKQSLMVRSSGSSEDHSESIERWTVRLTSEDLGGERETYWNWTRGHLCYVFYFMEEISAYCNIQAMVSLRFFWDPSAKCWADSCKTWAAWWRTKNRCIESCRQDVDKVVVIVNEINIMKGRTHTLALVHKKE